jgi:hypothetical protein
LNTRCPPRGRRLREGAERALHVGDVVERRVAVDHVERPPGVEAGERRDRDGRLGRDAPLAGALACLLDGAGRGVEAVDIGVGPLGERERDGRRSAADGRERVGVADRLEEPLQQRRLAVLPDVGAVPTVALGVGPEAIPVDRGFVRFVVGRVSVGRIGTRRAGLGLVGGGRVGRGVVVGRVVRRLARRIVHRFACRIASRPCHVS